MEGYDHESITGVKLEWFIIPKSYPVMKTHLSLTTAASTSTTRSGSLLVQLDNLKLKRTNASYTHNHSCR